jgi:hypothetical protein
MGAACDRCRGTHRPQDPPSTSRPAKLTGHHPPVHIIEEEGATETQA